MIQPGDRASSLPLVAWFDQASDLSSDLLGGKCWGLAQMTAAGLDVPPGFAITTAANESFLERSLARYHEAQPHPERHLDDASAEAVPSTDRLAVMHDLAQSLPMDETVEAAVVAAYQELGRRVGRADPPVAVRSSGQSEDGEDASFAGQYDTFLWVIGADAVVSAVKRGLVGSLADSTLSYRVDRSLGVGFTPMCLGVQLMVDARSAGVMFTLDPRTGDRSRVVIESSWGLGEAVVRGDVRPDRISVNKVTGAINFEEVGDKLHEYRFDASSGTVVATPVDEARQVLPSLSDDEISRLVSLGRRVEKLRASPQDTEWAIDHDGRIFLLQVRPETVWSTHVVATQASEGRPRRALDCVVAMFSGED